MASVSMNTDTTSLGEFTKCLVAELHKNNIDMPLRDEGWWHALFYELKTNAPEKSRFLTELRFDWDGPYPKCQQLSRYLHALHWNAGVGALNPRYSTIQLGEDLAHKWMDKQGQLEPSARTALEFAVKRAKSMSSSESR